jgi:hypothetical protein
LALPLTVGVLALPNACAVASEGEGDVIEVVEDPEDDAGVTLAAGGGAGASSEDGGSGGRTGSGGSTDSGGGNGSGGNTGSGGAQGSGGNEGSGGSDASGGSWFGFGGDWFGSGGSTSDDCGDLRSWESNAEMNIEQGEEIEHNGTRYRATQFIYWTNAECAPDDPVEWCAGWFEAAGSC